MRKEQKLSMREQISLLERRKGELSSGIEQIDGKLRRLYSLVSSGTRNDMSKSQTGAALWMYYCGTDENGRGIWVSQGDIDSLKVFRRKKKRELKKVKRELKKLLKKDQKFHSLFE